MAIKEYNDSSIESLSDIEHIRRRSSAYIPDTHISGQYYIIKEIVDNSNDELSIKLTNNVGELEVFIFKSNVRSTYQAMVVDNGRGIPIGKLIDSFANAKTSGKFNTDSYQFSAGLFGVGGTVSMALSNWFRAITLNTKVIGDATLRYDSIPNKLTKITNHTGSTGTIVMFEPDSTIFTGIADFMADYSILKDYLVQLSLFAKYSTKLHIIDEEIPNEVRIASTLQILDFINDCRSNVPVYDSKLLNRAEYIHSFFELTKPWLMSINRKGSNTDNTLIADITIDTILPASVPRNTKLTFVNNILFTDDGSLHIKLLHEYIRDQMHPKIQDPNIRSFFMSHYRLPLWLTMDIKFAGAQFAGMAKLSFRDKNFIKPYRSLLKSIFTNADIEHLYELVEEHIVAAYNRFSNKDLKVTNMKHLLTQLNRPTHFNDCGTTNRDKAELFLVEGKSAKSDQDRQSEFQATYTLGGKPFNGLTTLAKLGEVGNAIKNNHIFQDIIRILNITPGSNNLDNLNFGKLLVMADADTHGYHITNIILGNLYALCPALIDEGKVYIVTPPLYCLNIAGSKETLFIKNEKELNTMLAYHVYYRCIDITIESDCYRKVMTRNEFVTFAEIVNRIGEAVTRLSVEYFIPAPILEQLSLMTNHLNLTDPDINAISEALGYETRYIESSNILVLSVGSEDVIVPLTQITDLIYSRILPLYRAIHYGKTRLYATTKRSKAMKDTPISIVQLYNVFEQLNGLFDIDRNKGLGAMLGSGRAISCVNPKTRRIHQVTDMGNLESVFRCLGSDPAYRKKIVMS